MYAARQGSFTTRRGLLRQGRYLGLEAVLQRRTRSFQRRLQPFGDDVMYLATERSLAAPIASRRDIDLGVKGAVGAKRHIAGDEDEIARRHRGIVAGSRERLARQSELVDSICTAARF
jgi:hypothetical protein